MWFQSNHLVGYGYKVQWIWVWSRSTYMCMGNQDPCETKSCVNTMLLYTFIIITFYSSYLSAKHILLLGHIISLQINITISIFSGDVSNLNWRTYQANDDTRTVFTDNVSIFQRCIWCMRCFYFYRETRSLVLSFMSIDWSRDFPCNETMSTNEGKDTSSNPRHDFN